MTFVSKSRLAVCFFFGFFSVGSVRVNIYSEYLTDTHWDE